MNRFHSIPAGYFLTHEKPRELRKIAAVGLNGVFGQPLLDTDHRQKRINVRVQQFFHHQERGYYRVSGE